jgi:hypothetical protein
MRLSANKVVALFVVILVWSGFALLATGKARAWFWFFCALYPSNNLEMSVWFFAFGAAMAGLYLYLVMYASIMHRAAYAWIAIALLIISGITGCVRMSIIRSNTSRGKVHTSDTEICERARPSSRWPSGLSMNINSTFHRSGTAGSGAGRVPSLPICAIRPPRQPTIPDEGQAKNICLI